MGLVLLPLLLVPQATAQQVASTAEPAPLVRGYRTRALAGGWGHSWLHGWPGYGKAVSDIQYVAFYPQMGWFVTNWLELMLEFRNHHISNAGTRGENLGVNAAMVVAGVHWVLR